MEGTVLTEGTARRLSGVDGAPAVCLGAGDTEVGETHVLPSGCSSSPEEAG